MPTTAEEAISTWLTAEPGFVDAFPGGLHYDAAPAGEGLEYPFVSFSRSGSTRTLAAGFPSWTENVSYTFDIWDTGDMGDGAEIAESARILEELMFGERGAHQTPLYFTRGRVLRRLGGIGEIGLAAGLGRGGADLFHATIEVTALVARDS